ncbi:hypothetical protein NLI96_g1342 [Meripilus lineatus]|uniref:Uncharacterized protein n=1 Tax=Meripilus lineatus TaxID=2056292 RepID=A0AAD5YIH9_9APHY|nr:hypothetical protein NLI96_g1342 [Physisporinus lineatus]
MAVPATFTTVNISGRFQQVGVVSDVGQSFHELNKRQNKSLSDDTDEILSLQGVGWLTRKALKAANATLSIKHYTDETGVERIDIETTLTGGLAGSNETRILDWQEHKKADGIFGPAIGKSRKIPLNQVTEAYLKEGWASDANEAGVLNVHAQSDTGKTSKTWTSEQIWGVQEIGGVKRFARRIYFIGPKGEQVTARVVYDYLGEV